MKKIGLILSLALLAAVLPGAAEAKPALPKIKRAAFKVTVDGIQRTSWKLNHVGKGGCDGNATGAGTEALRFTSKPKTLRAMYFKGLSNPILSIGRVTPAIPLRGKVTRAGKVNADEGLCGGTGGGQKVAPDCGAKSIRGAKVTLEYLLRSKSRIGLARYLGIDDPFRNCPSGGFSFPNLVDQNTNDSRVGSKLPIGELFDRRLGKIILIGKGKRTESDSDGTYTSTIRWVVTLQRLGAKKR